MAELKLVLNGKTVLEEIAPDMLLLDFVRSQGCYSVKRGCETANCGLCTVLVDGTPMLSCSTLAMRANGKTVTTMEGMQEEAAEFGAFLANEGAEQCGYCSPGFIMNVIAMSIYLSCMQSWIGAMAPANICLEICADARGIWDSFVRFRNS